MKEETLSQLLVTMNKVIDTLQVEKDELKKEILSLKEEKIELQKQVDDFETWHRETFQ
jgi:FtsZ-binding cell division protein ZapB